MEQQEFERIHVSFMGMDPLLKPKLPKLQFKTNTWNIIKKVNAIIAAKITQEIPIEDLHALIYTEAVSVLQINGH